MHKIDTVNRLADGGKRGLNMILWQEIVDFVNTHGIKIISVLSVILIGFILIRIIKRATKKLLEKRKVDKIVEHFIVSIVYMILIIILIVSVFDMLDISTTPFVTILGTVGLALALSLQDSLSNIASGIIVIITKPFKQEDYVNIGGVEGSVKKISLLYTELYTFDNKIVRMPNNKLTKTEIINFTTLSTRRIDLIYNVVYGTSIEKVKEVIGSVIDKNQKIIKDPLPIIRLYEHAASSLQFAVKVWVNTPDYWNVYFDMQEQVYIALKEAGMGIPYNKMEINVVNKEQNK